MNSFATNFLQSMLVQSPVLIVYIVGFAMSFATRARHPRVSTLALTGSCVGIIALVAFTGILSWLPYSQYKITMVRANLYIILAAVRSLCAAGGLSLWLMAIFSSRDEIQPGFPVEQFPRQNIPPFTPRR